MLNGAFPGGKVALVTGGSRGIGAGISQALATNGVSVVVNGRTRETVEQTVARLRESGGCAMPGVADCTSEADLERMRSEIENEWGPVDLLVANAGGGGYPVPTASADLAGWRSTIEENLTSCFLTIRTFLPSMISRKSGAIVTLSSSAGRKPSRSSAAYAAAKAGVVMLTRHLANELAGTGVRINCIAPGAILTPGGALAAAPEEVRNQVAASLPVGRIGEPEDVANATLFLLSDASSWITGVTLDVSGGLHGT